jgi:hypothetical protein
MKKLQTLVLILAPSYFIGRFLIGIILEKDDGYCSGTCFEASML